MRTEQSVRPSPIILEQQAFRDHQGREATRIVLRYADSQVSSSGATVEPPFVFQLYTSVTLNDDKIAGLIDYIGHGIDCWSCVWEVYRDFPDVYACIDHQRCEIVHRKQTGSTRLIPKVALSPHDSRRYGFLILITSDSYSKGPPPSRHIDPNGPLFVHFDRRFPTRCEVDRLYLLEDDPEVARAVGISQDEIAVLPERIDIQIQRIQDTYAMRWTVWSLIKKSQLDTGAYDYGLTEDEGTPLYSHEIEITQQSRPHSSVTISIPTLSPPESIPDLHYLIYMSFLSTDNNHNTSLEAAAKLFTTSLAAQLPPEQTLLLEFYTPSDGRLSTIISLHKDQLQARPQMVIGALRINKRDGQRRRFYPCGRYDSDPANARTEPYNTFIVIIDKPNFVSEPGGVLFLMTDGGKVKPWRDEHGRELPNPYIGPDSDYVETLVLRSAGMAEVSRRLGMLVMNE